MFTMQSFVGSMLGMALFAGSAMAAGVPLEFALSTPLKQPNCGEDTDSDCLSDPLERDLAWIVSPHHFFDEDEDCPSRFMYYQVRPDGAASSTQDVSAWTPGGGTYRVNVTYFINFTKDCNGTGGHTGDNEHVRFVLESTDLTIWRVQRGIFPAHGDPPAVMDRAYLVARATEIGTTFPSVASDEDGHGSFPGESGNSDGCGGPNDGPLRDCFSGTMRSDYQNRSWTWLVSGAELARNIGEPWGYWNQAVLKTDETRMHAWSEHWNGSTNAPEYWSDTTGSRWAAYKQFCGWQCVLRLGSGANWTCYGEPNSNGTLRSLGACTSPQWDKVDRSCFRVNLYNYFWSGC